MNYLLKKFITDIFILLFVLIVIMFPCSSNAQDNGQLVLKGKVYNSVTRKPVDFATVVILEARVKTQTEADGSYSIKIPEPGEYTVIVRSTGLKMLKTTMDIRSNITRDFRLMPISITGAGLTIFGERDIQKISRRTMTVEELKETPASFGDSLTALSSQPGVERVGGIFGPLVIRGMYSDRNRYYIDGMPINNPMHFGGLHSVINTSLMSEIDLYASAFPSQFGGPLAAVIDINSVDTVKEFGGYTDIGLISTSALIQTPITRLVMEGDEIKEENAGYFIVSGRYGYLSLFIPAIIEATTDQQIEFAPEYYDYQIKGKYYLNTRNSLSLLFLGSSDKMKFVFDEDAEIEEEGGDPLFADFDLQTDEMFNNLGLYYTYKLDRFNNRLMAYASLSRHNVHIKSGQEDVADWFKDFYQDIEPYIYGVKDDVNIEWWKNRAKLRCNIEYSLYHFTAKGISIINNTNELGFDIADDTLVRADPFDLSFVNHAMSGYMDNKFTFGGFTFVPGVRFDYYFRSEEMIFDPRGMVSYEFPTDTTLSAAGGQYSSHFQLNPYMFSFFPEIADMEYAHPEKAYHTVIGIEQVIGLFTFEIEAYYNYFKDIAWGYPHYENGEYRLGLNSGEVKVKGFEILLRKNKREGTDDFFGWLSYTYNRSNEKTGITGNQWLRDPVTGIYYETNQRFDPTGHKWHTSDEEILHSLKLVMGYSFTSSHKLSCRFQLYSPSAYTPIVNSIENPPDSGRYVPIYSQDINSAHFNTDHRLDLRYSYKTNYEWGYVTWYIEVIDVYGYWYHPAQFEEWDYSKPYIKGENPKLDEETEGLPFIPNFGVEVKF